MAAVGVPYGEEVGILYLVSCPTCPYDLENATEDHDDLCCIRIIVMEIEGTAET